MSATTKLSVRYHDRHLSSLRVVSHSNATQVVAFRHLQVDLLLAVIDGSDRDLIVRIWDKDISAVLGETTMRFKWLRSRLDSQRELGWSGNRYL